MFLMCYLYVSLTLICTCVLYGLHVTLVLYISGFAFIATRVLGFGVQEASFSSMQVSNNHQIQIHCCSIHLNLGIINFGKRYQSNATWDGGIYNGHI